MKIISYARLCILPKQSLRLQEMDFRVLNFQNFKKIFKKAIQSDFLLDPPLLRQVGCSQDYVS